MGESYNTEIEYGFLILKTFSRLYRDNVNRYNLKSDCYAVPRIDKKPEQYAIQYRGLDRDALYSFEHSNNLAEIRMAELEKLGRCRDSFF
jgi:hypothetical protein